MSTFADFECLNNPLCAGHEAAKHLVASVLEAVQSTLFLDCAEDGGSNILINSVTMCHHTWHHNPGDCNLCQHRCESFTFRAMLVFDGKALSAQRAASFAVFYQLRWRNAQGRSRHGACANLFEESGSSKGGVEKTTFEELHDLYSSPNIIRLIKSRRIRWAGMWNIWGEMWGAYRMLVGRSGKETTWKT